MSGIVDKVKEKVKGAKDKVVDTTKEGVSSSTNEQERGMDPTKEYDEKEPMSPAKIKEHEPTAVSRDPSDQRITEPGQTETNPEDAKERARRSGMTKGTAGVTETGSESE